MSEENKAIVRRFYDALWNIVNAEAVDELMDAECDGDICHLRPEGSLPFTEEAFSAANSALYADSVLARFDYMTKTHPELANSIMKRLIIRHEGNLHGVIKSSAKKYKEVVPDVRCTIEEMIAQENMVWTRWTLRGRFHSHGSTPGASLDGKRVIVIGASICRLTDGKIRDYRSYALSDRWLESVAGIIPRP